MKTLRKTLKLSIPESLFDRTLETELLSYIQELWETINFGPYFNVVSKTSAYTVTAADVVVLCDATSAPFTVTLPPAGTGKNKVYYIKKTDVSVNAVTVDGSGSETIDGAATASLSGQYDSIGIVSDGTSWYKISETT